MSLEQEIEIIVERKLEEFKLEIKPIDYRPWIFSDDVAEVLRCTEEWVLKKYTKNELYLKKKLIRKQGGRWEFKHPEFLEFVHENF